MNKIKKVKKSADDSLAKVRSKRWSKPLGKTLEVTGKIVTAIGTAVPGVGILGSALSMGATLLNPEPTLKDLQKSMNEIKQELKSISETDEVLKAILEEGLREEIKEMEKKIATPMSEIRSDLKMIHVEMLEVKKDIQDGNGQIAKELSKIKDTINQTFNIVVDEKYKDGIEYVDAAYDTFIMEKDFEDFQSHAFELQTIANQNLKPGKIQEYMIILHDKSESGADTCRTTLNYIIVVLGKYLQMVVAYHIHKGDLDVVDEDFAKFNSNFYKLVQDFSEVTGEEFMPRFGDEQEEVEFSPKASISEVGCEGCAEKENKIEALEKELKDAYAKILNQQK